MENREQESLIIGIMLCYWLKESSRDDSPRMLLTMDCSEIAFVMVLRSRLVESESNVSKTRRSEDSTELHELMNESGSIRKRVLVSRDQGRGRTRTKVETGGFKDDRRSRIYPKCLI